MQSRYIDPVVLSWLKVGLVEPQFCLIIKVFVHQDIHDIGNSLCVLYSGEKVPLKAVCSLCCFGGLTPAGTLLTPSAEELGRELEVQKQGKKRQDEVI